METKEILFENKYVITKSFIKEYTRTFSNNRLFFILLVVLFLVIIAEIGTTLVTRIDDPMFHQELIRFFLLWASYFLLLAGLVYYGYTYHPTKQFKQLQELQNGHLLEVALLVNEDSIIQGDIVISFEKFKKAIETRNLILLCTKERQCFALTKDGFTKGSKDQFETFLRSKNIKIKKRKFIYNVFSICWWGLIGVIGLLIVLIFLNLNSLFARPARDPWVETRIVSMNPSIMFEIENVSE